LSLSLSPRLLVAVLVFAVLLPSVLPVHATIVYAAGVTVGQWASYTPINVTYHSTSSYFPEPQDIKDLNNTVLATATVQHVWTSVNVTVQSVILYKNSTTKTEISNGDLMTGAGNLTYSLISGGLVATNPIWTTPNAPVINFTEPMNYLGVSRSVNIWNITASSPDGSTKISAEFDWDQLSGIVLEAKSLIIFSGPPSIGGYVEYIDLRISATNIYSPPPRDFGISINPASITVQAGSSQTATVTIASLNGFYGTVSLTTDTGTYASLNPTSVTLSAGGTETSILTLSTTTATPPGSFDVIITGTYTTNYGPITHSATLHVTVTAPPDFGISVNPTTLTVQAGSSQTATVTVTSVNGFAGTVSLAATNGAYASLNPTSVTLSAAGTETSILTFSTTATTPTGSYDVTVTGTYGTISHLHPTTLHVTVTAPTPTPDFTITASNPASVSSGTSATSTITVAANNGFAGTVMLTATAPSGLTCNPISPGTLTGYGTASLSCSSTTAGTYTVTITATSGSTTHTTTTTMTITAAPSQTPSAPATILGLDPTLFYALIGAIIALLVIGGVTVLMRRNRRKLS
jgi:hypothetical protein